MYTQCPQCEAAFRITVDVLQQARGQVRCGSCDHAFNALDHLSEEPPETRAKEPETQSADEDLERSQLLETLDRLAGTEDVRIEDTGVEWRVVDDDDVEDEPTDVTPAPKDDAASSSLRWILEDAPDETLDDEDVIPDTAETTQNEVLSAAAIESADSPPVDDDEPRYDDNTLLPDDFEEQHQYTAPTPQRRATDRFEFVIEDDTSPQSDLELSEPDDWTDLLDDLAPPDSAGAASDIVAPEEAEAPAETPANDTSESPAEDPQPAPPEPDAPAEVTASEDTSTDAPAGPDPDRDEEIALVASQLDELLDTMGTKPVQALADSMGADIDDGEEDNRGDDAAAAAVPATGDEATFEALAEEAIDALSDEPAEEPAEEPVEGPIETLIDESPDERADDGVAASTDDESIEERIDDAIDDIVDDVVEAAQHPVPYADVVDPNDEPDDVVAQDDLDESTEAEAAFEAQQEEEDALVLASADVPEFIDIDDESREDVTALELSPDDAIEDPPYGDDDAVAYGDAAVESETGEDDVRTQATDDSGTEDGTGAAETPADSAADADVDDEFADLAAMTGNMPIDADMLRAMQDSDFAATMTHEDGSPVVETIIMEGDQVSDALADRELSGRLETLTDPASFIDTYITKKGAKGATEQSSRKRTLGLAAVLLVMLVVQFVHHTRESLATIGAFNQTIGPLYQMLGDPITPNWDIRGWQFEATNGSTDESDSVLTIYSRLSNRAEDALPYPIVHVALTDRFEEVIGSRMLNRANTWRVTQTPNGTYQPARTSRR